MEVEGCGHTWLPQLLEIMGEEHTKGNDMKSPSLGPSSTRILAIQEAHSPCTTTKLQLGLCRPQTPRQICDLQFFGICSCGSTMDTSKHNSYQQEPTHWKPLSWALVNWVGARLTPWNSLTRGGRGQSMWSCEV